MKTKCETRETKAAFRSLAIGDTFRFAESATALLRIEGGYVSFAGHHWRCERTEAGVVPIRLTHVDIEGHVVFVDA